MSNDKGEKKMIFRQKPVASGQDQVQPDSPPSPAVALPDAPPPGVEPVNVESPAANKPLKPEAGHAQARKFVLKRTGPGKSGAEKPDGGVGKPVQGVATTANSKGKFRFAKPGTVVSAPAAVTVPQTAPVVKREFPWKSIAQKLISILKLSAVIILVGGIGFLVYWLATRGTTAGHFGAIKGSVEVYTGPRMRMALSQTRIVSGDSIRALPGSTACVMLGASDAESMQIYENSMASLRVVKKTQTAPEGRLVNLESGMIDMDVMSPVKGRTIMVRTTNAVVTFNTGRFLLSSTNGYTELNVREGPVSIAQRGNEEKGLSVEAGLWVGVGAGVPFEKRSLSGETEVCNLFLIDSNDGQPAADVFAEPLKSEVLLDRNKVTGAFGIRATTVPSVVGSVKFEMDGCPVVILNEEPYIFRGKPGADVGDGWRPDRGNFTLTVTAYSRKDCTGKSSVPRTILFRVKGTAEY